MKLFSAHIEDLRSLYLDNLMKALDMEQTIVKSLPDLIENSTDKELREAFRMHLEESRGHVSTVERMLRDRRGQAETKACKVMNGLATEASDTIKDATDPSVRDIALIGAAQQVEHHEIAVYGTLRRWAELLGLDEDAALLESIEAEEENADAVLTEISDRVNLEGAAGQATTTGASTRRTR
jgi:ferritin-like metal-binding protein YciE